MTLRKELQQVLTDPQIKELTDGEKKTLKVACEKMYTRKHHNKDGTRTKPYAGFWTLSNLLERKFGLTILPSQVGDEGQDTNKLEPINDSMLTQGERDFYAYKNANPDPLESIPLTN